MVADDGRRRKHPRLGGLDADVACDGFDLAGDDVERDLVETLDAHRVLHRHGGHRDAGVHAEEREGAHIGLDARAAAGVRTGDRHHPRWGLTAGGQR